MIQSYSLIFWKKQMHNADTLSLTKIVCEIFRNLVTYNNALYPRYLPARSKKGIKEFVFREETIYTLLDHGLKKERKYSPNLGTTLGFFTSLDEEKSARISFSIGYDSPVTGNANVIDLPAAMNSFIGENTDLFYTLFCDKDSVITHFASVERIAKPFATARYAELIKEFAKQL